MIMDSICKIVYKEYSVMCIYAYIHYVFCTSDKSTIQYIS